LDLLGVAGAGVFAGAVNTIAGAGSLVTYPVLVALGLSPLSANVTNDIGVVPGNITGALGFRAEFQGQGPLLRRVLPVAAAGSVLGAVILLIAPEQTFQQVVPVLLVLASVLTAVQPMLVKRLQRDGQAPRGMLATGVAAIAVYGGYFGTGIGLLFFAVLGLFVDDLPRRLNASKQLLALICNGLAGVIFVAVVAPVNWPAAAVLAVSSGAGGPLGARLSRYIPATALRIVVSTVGVLAAGYLWWRD
jgi:uncharacterized membrane protein YfcA